MENSELLIEITIVCFYLLFAIYIVFTIVKHERKVRRIVLNYESDKVKLVRDFAYFTANFPYDFIEKVWNDNLIMAVHLRNKLNGQSLRLKINYVSFEAFMRWFFDLDDENQRKLIVWISNNYHIN